MLCLRFGTQRRQPRRRQVCARRDALSSWHEVRRPLPHHPGPSTRARDRRRSSEALVSILHAGGERARRGLLPSARTAGCVVVFVCARSSASRTRTPTCSSSARADSASRSRSRLEPHAPCLPAALCPPRLPRAQCQIYEADSEVVTGEMRVLHARAAAARAASEGAGRPAPDEPPPRGLRVQRPQPLRRDRAAVACVGGDVWCHSKACACA